MKKTIAEMLAAAAAQRAVAAAANASGNPAASAATPALPATPEEGNPNPAADAAPTAPLTVQEDGSVVVDAGTVKDGTVIFKVVDGKLDGVNVGVATPAAPSEGVLELATRVGELTVAKAAADAEITDLTCAVAAMVPILSASLDRMEIALGGGKVDVSKLDTAQLVAMHEAASARFAAKFPVGGVAAVAEQHDKAAETKNTERDVLLRRAKLTAGVR